MRPLDLFAVMGPLTPISDLGLTRDKNALLERVNQVQGRLGGFVPPRSPIEEAHMRLGGGDLTRIRAQVSLSALESLAVHLGGLREGRKSILFVSQGPPMLRGGARHVQARCATSSSPPIATTSPFTRSTRASSAKRA